MNKCLFLALVIASFTSCGKFFQSKAAASEASDTTIAEDVEDMIALSPFDHVVGHDERDTIVGNFTGTSIDTIFIVIEDDPEPSDFQTKAYWAVCSNPRVKPVRIWGHDNDQPKLVFEGDLDGNGTDEWGYLQTWIVSQWRSYCVFTYYHDEWRYLTDSHILLTPEYLRRSGCDLVEPGPQKGTVLVHYAPNDVNSSIIDTIITPNFAKFDKE